MPHASAAVFQRVGLIMVEQLEAEIMIAHGKTNSGLELSARTPAEEDKLSFEFGAPIIVKPAHELYGDELVRAGRPKEAVKEFQLAVLHAPKRALSLQGLARAQAGSGDTSASEETLSELKTFWRGERNQANAGINSALK